MEGMRREGKGKEGKARKKEGIKPRLLGG